jgi:hypothetical protein
MHSFSCSLNREDTLPDLYPLFFASTKSKKMGYLGFFYVEKKSFEFRSDVQGGIRLKEWSKGVHRWVILAGWPTISCFSCSLNREDTLPDLYPLFFASTKSKKMGYLGFFYVEKKSFEFRSDVQGGIRLKEWSKGVHRWVILAWPTISWFSKACSALSTSGVV